MVGRSRLSRYPERMALETLELQSGPNPVASIVVLHGLGADGSDFVPIAEQLDLSAIGDVRFVFPDAPVRPVTVNGGYQMRAWYDIFNADLVRREDEAGLRASLADVQALLDREAALGIAPQRTVLMGFSQGCAMTLLAGLRAPQRLAGLACLSGYLPLAARTAAERSAANQDVQIFMAHGRFDPIVTIDRGLASCATLAALGYAIDWREYPMEHSVCEEEIDDLNRWLLKVLA
ncbi:phospholipase/Carboxylesterase [Leptothrix cholodnii SP-6]|uniref:Phospholipase/Carboxylesterase n=2 Tax=Leptothrix cholodnii TaxID=34029 RepID=B1Y0E9_LEPCP|nr:phospholipase/Carboxylesterase [Leptothrix cholodnii SP-6]